MKIKGKTELPIDGSASFGKTIPIWSELDRILLQFAVQRGLANPEHSRCHQFIAIELGNRTQYGLPLHVSKGENSALGYFWHQTGRRSG